ncbi:MAG: nucleotide-binding protein, partial [candidate division NC10 bacterium]|nr:nucleotide-binding protein [candidate division NC10 bacterium]
MDILTTIEQLIAEGERLRPQGGTPVLGHNGDLQPEYVSWRLQAIDAIQQLGQSAKSLLKEIEADSHGSYFFKSSADRVLGALKAGHTIAKRQSAPRGPEPAITAITAPSRRVFLVHGHDQAILQQTARFLEKLDLQPVILFEQPGKNQSIVEKLEAHSKVSFAIVLLTPDDTGKAAGASEASQPRARQNVILELGYFLGKLGRSQVAVLYDESVELPSDYRGIEYVKLDAEGAWKLKLAKEL